MTACASHQPKDLTDSLVQAMVRGTAWPINLPPSCPGCGPDLLMSTSPVPIWSGCGAEAFAFCCRCVMAELRAGARRSDDHHFR